MTPYEATLTENTATVFKLQKSNKSSAKPKFKIGDRVRIYKWKNKFEKGQTQNWTKEIFVVLGINNTDPITYEIEDLNNEPILGSFYAKEMNLTKF